MPASSSASSGPTHSSASANVCARPRDRGPRGESRRGTTRVECRRSANTGSGFRRSARRRAGWAASRARAGVAARAARGSARVVSARARPRRENPAVDFVDPRVEEYAAAHTTQPEPLLAALADETQSTLERPQMLTGTIEGRFLELLVHGLGARRVL